MYQLHKRHKLPKPRHREIDNQNRPIPIKEFEPKINNFLNEKAPDWYLILPKFKEEKY